MTTEVSLEALRAAGLEELQPEPGVVVLTLDEATQILSALVNSAAPSTRFEARALLLEKMK